MKKNKTIKKSLAFATYLINVVLVIGLLFGNYYANMYSHIVSTYFNHATSKVISSNGSSDTEYFKSDYKNKEDLKKHGEKLVQEIVEEGSVLLTNKDQALPLEGNEKISLLGQTSVDLVYGGGGAGSVDTSTATNLFDAMKASGFEVNEKLWDFYKTGAGKDYRKTTPDVFGKGEFSVNEVPNKLYTADIKDSFKEYNDVAVVVIGRSGGESSDLSTEKLSTGSHFLQIDQNEKDLLKMAQENFDKVVVILNTNNPIETGFLDEYDIDATLWVGALGKTGANALGEILNGNVSPSGRLVDTYAQDLFSAPAMANFGDYSFTNSEVDRGDKYMVYAEGIYVGYKYYETRYEDVVLGNEEVSNYDYSKQVKYPFGYGISYTDFEYSDYKVSDKGENYEVSLKVTNKGDIAGKEVVQVYMQSPYTEYDKTNNIEKPSVTLVGFTKTDKLEKGKSQIVKLDISKEEMKVYDAKNAKTYILDAGDYYFATGKNSHDALNNILASKGKTTADKMDYDGDKDLSVKFNVKEQDNKKYAKSTETDNVITNQFGDVDITTYDSSFKYLSRSDWKNTWPTTYKDGKFELSADLLKSLEPSHTEDTSAKMPTTGKVDKETGKLKIASFIGVDYDDPMWDTLLNQLTVEEMVELVRMGGYATIPLSSISLPATVVKDGPAGISSTLTGGGTDAMSFPAEITIASTWNVKLAEEMGKAIGEDSLESKVQGWYAPGINIHRAPFSGRNFEYYSEDSYISGKLSSATVTGVQSKGSYVFMKHYALNDQETNRIGGSMFANEQSIREIYLKPFETTTIETEVSGVMASLNRIGTRWTGGHAGLMKETLVKEWGFKGIAITDQASYSVFAYQEIIEGLEAGTNLWLNTDANLWHIKKADLKADVVNDLRNSTHNILYTIVNSNAMNGIAPDDKVVAITPLWQKLLYGADALIIVAVIGSTYFVTKRLRNKKQEETKSEA